jgi:hypothetical protein
MADEQASPSRPRRENTRHTRGPTKLRRIVFPSSRDKSSLWTVGELLVGVADVLDLTKSFVALRLEFGAESVSLSSVLD